MLADPANFDLPKISIPTSSIPETPPPEDRADHLTFGQVTAVLYSIIQAIPSHSLLGGGRRMKCERKSLKQIPRGGSLALFSVF